MNDMHLDQAEKDLEPTRSVPAVNDRSEGTQMEKAAEAERSAESTAPNAEEAKPAVRRRRAERLHAEDEMESAAARAAYTENPVFQAESATARAFASRIQAPSNANRRDGMPADPGSRVPPQAARMSAAARSRMGAQPESRYQNARRDQIGYTPGRIRESEEAAARGRMEGAWTMGAGNARQRAEGARPMGVGNARPSGSGAYPGPSRNMRCAGGPPSSGRRAFPDSGGCVRLPRGGQADGAGLDPRPGRRKGSNDIRRAGLCAQRA